LREDRRSKRRASQQARLGWLAVDPQIVRRTAFQLQRDQQGVPARYGRGQTVVLDIAFDFRDPQSHCPEACARQSSALKPRRQSSMGNFLSVEALQQAKFRESSPFLRKLGEPSCNGSSQTSSAPVTQWDREISAEP
jgi:hypothetical protein